MRKLGALLISVVGVGYPASPAMAETRAIPASGSVAIAWDLATLEIVDHGQQCLLRVEQTLTYSGTLQGTSETVGPTEFRFFAPCEEVLATGGVGIRRHVSDVEHFVGDDGREATFRQVGRGDTSGEYQGIIALHGDLNGTLRTSESGFGPFTYEGTLIVRD